MRRLLHSCAAAMAVGVLVLAWTSVASAQPCMIFVHGKQTDTNTYTNWNSARNYWKNGSNDFIQAATKSFATSYYVVGYNGTILRSSDRGKTWTKQFSGTGNNLYGLFFTKKYGWAVGAGGVVLQYQR